MEERMGFRRASGFRSEAIISQTGRWNAVDPLAEVMPQWSAYSYAFNNPLRYIDPDGRMPLGPPTRYEKPSDLFTKTPAIFMEGMQEAGRQVNALWERYGPKSDGTDGYEFLGAGLSGNAPHTREGSSSKIIDLTEIYFPNLGGADVRKIPGVGPLRDAYNFAEATQNAVNSVDKHNNKNTTDPWMKSDGVDTININGVETRIEQKTHDHGKTLITTPIKPKPTS